MQPETRKRLRRIPILFNVFIILMTALTLLDQGRSFGYAYLACAGLYLVMVILTFSGRLREELWVDGAGAILLVVAAIDLFLQGKKGLPYAYLVAAIMGLVAARIRRNRDRRSPQDPAKA